MKGPFQIFQPRSISMVRGFGLIVVLAVLCGGLLNASAQRKQERQGLREPVYRVQQANRQNARQPNKVAQADTTAPTAQRGQVRLVADTTTTEAHPLDPFIETTERLLKRMDENVKDYSAQLVKRERINGVLNASTYMEAKIRHEQVNARGEVVTPFSVYLHFISPDEVKGREVLWKKGHNNGELIAHDGGTGLLAALKSSVTVSLEPDSAMAMKGNKYPIYNIGMRNLLVKLGEEARKEKQHGEVEVKEFKNTKINGRVCTCLQSVHPVKRNHFRYHIVRVYIDDELQLPIRYEAYDFPTREGQQPPLQEEYTYLNVKVNNGFTDADFDRNNRNYRFN